MESRSLLVSDVDNTLLGDDEATRRFARWVSERRDRLRIAYNSGRFVESVLESVSATDLPAPDAVVGGVGTQIFFPQSQSYLEGWPPDRGRWNASAVRGCLADHEGLELQPQHLQSPFKVSYYGYELSGEKLSAITEQLGIDGIAAQVVYSSERDLDILPKGTGKGAATAFLADHWEFPPERTIVAGDSGNDLAMFQQGFRGIVVANAHPELKALNEDHIYHAAADFADGVLQGLAHWMNA